MLHLYKHKHSNPTLHLLVNPLTNTSSLVYRSITSLIRDKDCALTSWHNLNKSSSINLKDYTLIASAENHIDFRNKYPELFI